MSDQLKNTMIEYLGCKPYHTVAATINYLSVATNELTPSLMDGVMQLLSQEPRVALFLEIGKERQRILNQQQQQASKDTIIDTGSL